MYAKRIVHSKMKICSKFTHPQANHDVDEVVFFIGTDLQKCSVTSLAHHWILCVPSEWVFKQMIKTSQSTSNHEFSSLTSCEVKRCVFVKNVFNFKLLHLTKIHCEKVILSESGEKYAPIKHHLHAEAIHNHSRQIFWCERTIGDGLFYCKVFFLDSHSDSTHSQQRIHWWTSDVWLCF